MATTYINLAQVTNIYCYPNKKRESIEKYTWTKNGSLLARLMGKTKETIFGYRERDWNGYVFYYGDSLTEYLKENSSYIGDDGEIYKFPYLEISMSDQRTRYKYFNTEEELNAWIEEAVKTVPTLTILKK